MANECGYVQLMDRKTRRQVLGMMAAAPLAAAPGIVTEASADTLSTAASPTDGWTSLSWNSSSFTVQNRTSAPLSERFTISGGIYTTRVFAGEQRVEMRWDNWADQRRENLWEADVMFERPTTNTAIMQIKSNTDGEPIYIQVFNPNGDVRNNGDSTAIARGIYGQWFNLKSAFNPVTGIGRAWINNLLAKTRQYRTPTSGWYFKNGTYNNGIPSSGHSVSHFRNFKLWRNDH